MDTVIRCGEMAPDFTLTSLDGEEYSLEKLRGWIVVLNFWSAECMWCEAVDHQLIGYLEAWSDQVKVLWIASNANETRELVEQMARERSLPVILLDTQHQVADLYGAQTTPQFFIVDQNGLLAYQGSWDDRTFRQRVASQVYVPQVVDALRQGLTPPLSQTQPYGCVLVRYAG